MAAITTGGALAQSAESLRVKAAVVCLQCESYVIHIYIFGTFTQRNRDSKI